MGTGIQSGYEAQIDCDGHANKTGSLYVLDGKLVGGVYVTEMLVPPDTWCTAGSDRRRGNHLVVKVNWKVTADFVDTQKQYARGHLAIDLYEPGTIVEFRRIDIKESKTTSRRQPTPFSARPPHLSTRCRPARIRRRRSFDGRDDQQRQREDDPHPTGRVSDGEHR